MPETTSPVHLSHVPTVWSQVFDAKGGQGGRTENARGGLLVRYHEAVYSFLLRKLGNPHAAGEVYSNFAVRVLEDDRLLGKVDPSRGRFRDYLKAVLHRMTVDYWRKNKGDRVRTNQDGSQGPPEPAAPEEPPPFDEPGFRAIWKQEILNQIWKALQDIEQKGGPPYFLVVRLNVEMPKIRSQQMAERLSQELGRPFTAANARKVMERGRKLFGELLVAEVARTLRETAEDVVTAQRIEEELIELELLFSFCKEALESYAKGE